MVMDVIQVRLSEGLIEKVDDLVQTGIYSNRSDVVRDAVRKLVLSNIVGIIKEKNDSVKEVKNIRKKLSSKMKSSRDLNEINKLIK